MLGCSALTDLGDLRGEAQDATTDASAPLSIACAGKTCDPTSSVCCATCDASPPCALACADPSATCSVVFACSSPGSCDGGLCCGSMHDGYFHGSECHSLAECNALEAPVVFLCDPNASTCDAGTSCREMGSAYPSMYTCQPP